MARTLRATRFTLAKSWSGVLALVVRRPSRHNTITSKPNLVQRWRFNHLPPKQKPPRTGIGYRSGMPEKSTNPTQPKRTRAEINRENAKKSTGPKTADGKVASSKNALKHGIYSKFA